MWRWFRRKYWNWMKNSGTIVLARMQYIVGIVFAGVIAAFSGLDWTALMALDAKTLFKMLAFSAVSGIVTEIVRRNGTKDETTIINNEEVVRLERVEGP